MCIRDSCHLESGIWNLLRLSVASFGRRGITSNAPRVTLCGRRRTTLAGEATTCVDRIVKGRTSVGGAKAPIDHRADRGRVPVGGRDDLFVLVAERQEARAPVHPDPEVRRRTHSVEAPELREFRAAPCENPGRPPDGTQ